MPDTKRITVPLTDDTKNTIKELKKQEQFSQLSDSEIIRYLIKCGLENQS